MTIEEFKKALKDLGWKQADFARKAGVTESTLSRWASGEVEIPKWAGAFVGMAGEIQQLHKKYVVPNKETDGQDL